MDTHGLTTENGHEGYIAFDLDATLAKYDGWKGIGHIGEPIKPMIGLVKRLIEKGVAVKILTARVAPRDRIEYGLNPAFPHIKNGDKAVWVAEDFVRDWVRRNIGKDLEITSVKDGRMLYLFDDRAVPIVPNEGVKTQDLPNEIRVLIED